jgi:hypothetical protein
MTDLSLFFDVFDPIAVLYALGAGIAFGSTVLLYTSLQFPLKLPMAASKMGLVAAVATGLAGFFFFAGQVVQAYASDDPLWPRALGRAGLWQVFSAAIGVGFSVARSFAHRSDGSVE